MALGRTLRVAGAGSSQARCPSCHPTISSSALKEYWGTMAWGANVIMA